MRAVAIFGICLFVLLAPAAMAVKIEVANDPAVDHWSFKPVSLPPVPRSIDDVSGSESIDRFVSQQLSESGLSMSPRAEAITLLRRVSFVLTGLPPTPDDVQRFLADPDGVDAAYRRAVDR